MKQNERNVWITTVGVTAFLILVIVFTYVAVTAK
jgi:hypothetical protein